MNNSINLLDYKNKIVVKKNNSNQKTIRLTAIGLLFLVSSSSIIFFILIAFSPLPELNRQHKIASFNLSHAVPEIVKIGLINERADNIKKIIDNRSSYDRILANLQKKLPIGVVFEAISIDKKSITLSISSNSLLRIEEFLNTLKKNDNESEKFSKIVLSSLSTDSVSDKFLVNLSIDIL